MTTKVKNSVLDTTLKGMISITSTNIDSNVFSSNTATLTTPLGISSGGTGASNTAGALTSLGAAARAGLSTQKFSVAAGTTTGDAVNFGQVLGLGQTWQQFTALTRVIGTTYYNTTGKPIFISIETYGTVTVIIGGVLAGGMGNTQSNNFSFIVPSGASYVCSAGTWVNWSELR